MASPRRTRGLGKRILIKHYRKNYYMNVPIMADLKAQGKEPEILFWVGCAGSFDDRAKKVTKAFVTILNEVGIDFAILGNEEQCTGDPARRAGNEFVFQMMAIQNVETLNMYNVKKIVATCPHCFNTLKNEYGQFGGDYDVIHHSQLLQELIDEGRIKMKEGGTFQGKKITYHDSCYMGRVNGVYEAPRTVLQELDADFVEMKRCKSKGLCCGAGGAQMWKEDEPGDKRINMERIDEALDTGAQVIAANCPFCLTMMQDGVTGKNKENDVMVYDLSELIVNNNDWS